MVALCLPHFIFSKKVIPYRISGPLLNFYCQFSLTFRVVLFFLRSVIFITIDFLLFCFLFHFFLDCIYVQPFYKNNCSLIQLFPFVQTLNCCKEFKRRSACHVEKAADQNFFFYIKSHDFNLKNA